MNTYFRWGLSCLLTTAVCLVQPAVAQGDPQQGFERQHPGAYRNGPRQQGVRPDPEQRRHFLESLNLSDEQKIAFKSFRQEKDSFRSDAEELRQARQQILKDMRGDEVTSRQILKRAEKLQKRSMDFNMRRLKNSLKLRDVLSQEQRKKIHSAIQQRRAQQGSWHPGNPQFGQRKSAGPNHDRQFRGRGMHKGGPQGVRAPAGPAGQGNDLGNWGDF